MRTARVCLKSLWQIGSRTENFRPNKLAAYLYNNPWINEASAMATDNLERVGATGINTMSWHLFCCFLRQQNATTRAVFSSLLFPETPAISPRLAPPVFCPRLIKKRRKENVSLLGVCSPNGYYLAGGAVRYYNRQFRMQNSSHMAALTASVGATSAYDIVLCLSVFRKPFLYPTQENLTNRISPTPLPNIVWCKV
jgi:hypothetical protein